MFRGLDAGDGARSFDYSHVIPLSGAAGPWSLDNQVSLHGSGSRSGREWNGAGGRWLLWPLRVVLWATLLIVAYRGVTGIITQPGAAAAGGAGRAGAAAGFAAFVPPSVAAAHPDLGWNGAGPPSPARQGSDPVARSELMSELPSFFQAYAAGDSAALDRFLARGVSLTGLGGAVSFDSITSLQVPPGGPARQITVTVIWQVPGQASAGATKLEMSYGMSVVDLQTGKWYVNEISAATEAVEAK